jgi:hypothetical protein
MNWLLGKGFGSPLRLVVGTQFLAWGYDMIPRVAYDHNMMHKLEGCLGMNPPSKWIRGYGIG